MIDYPHKISLTASDQGNGKRAMVLDVSDMRAIVAKVCARPDVLDACRQRDLGTVIAKLGTQQITQGQISALTGIPQGR